MNLLSWIGFFTLGWGSIAGLYIVLALGSAVTLRGYALVAPLLTLPLFASLLSTALAGLREGSNLWPLGLMFASPPIALSLAIAWTIGLAASKKGRPWQLALVPFGVVALWIGMVSIWGHEELPRRILSWRWPLLILPVALLGAWLERGRQRHRGEVQNV